MKAFHAYDIRGVYNKDFDGYDAYRVGYHLVKFLNVDTVVVGRDARESSPEIYQKITSGITDAGADVLDLGLATTPMVYYATAKYGYHASVQITASHNPKQYNGIKISRDNAIPVGYDTGLKEIERRMQGEPMVMAKVKGTIKPFNVKDEYVDFLKGFAQKLETLNVAVDCSNGMASLLVHDIFPDSYNYLYDTLDGTFPNHEANPLIEANTADLRKLVVDKKCDAGIIFDGDGDRVVFIDETGTFIPPDIMLGVMGLHFLDGKKEKEEKVLVDIRTSKSVAEFLKPLGGAVQTWRVGRAFMATKLREIEGLFGGELAGHYYFRDFFYSDSGILAAIILLDVVADLKKKKKTLSEVVKKIIRYANSGELNFSIADKQAAMDAVKTYFTSKEKPEVSVDYDGYRIEFKDWWFNIRPSNTEPLLRFVGEAKTQEILDEKIGQLNEVLKPFITRR